MSLMVCPYCGHEWDYDDYVEYSNFYEECPECGREFEVEVEWDPIFYTSKMEGNDDESDD